ncbi:prolyl oligopeptidase family serine peptidase [Sphingomonas sp. BT-65]|uniref:alpha/beta hydrolase family protein n=1 Tax=Sphingomonas sp. BT-65 TaxID=2989821 RepID=UPI002236B651|nr:alpha/beta fold hydrolase [Sphingomonas sp. BT-65]MCW4461214.1 prolyl oligopeptidase family serine peptidase [Sphingomonas sp. BT-65]
MSRIFVLAVASLALGGAAAPQTAAPAARAPLPTEAFAEVPQIDDPEISPDGKQIAGKVAIQGKQFFAVLTPGSSGPPKLLNPGKADLNWWSWVNDEWLVVGIGQEVPVEGDNWYVTRALGYSVVTGKVVQLPRNAAQRGDDVIWSARDGSARVMLAYQTSIYTNNPGFWPQVDEIDLATGKRRTVVPSRPGVASWYADGDGVVRMGIGVSEDGRSRRVHYRERHGATFRTIDKARTREERLTVPALFLRDMGKALIVDDDEGGYSALYELDLKTLERGKQLFASKGYDIGGIVRDASGFGYLGVAVNENRPEIRWVDPEMIAMQAAVSGLVKGAQVRIVSTSRDRSRAIVQVGGADAPGGYYIFARADNTMEPLGLNNPTIRMRRMHPVRTIRYKARDGLEIAAVLTLPAGRKEKLPLIVMPHGGPFARDSETWDWWTQFLADRGYAVIQPNYRGSSGYGTPFTEKGEGQWGLAMQDDLDDSVKALADLGIADPARVCMVGASYGGYAAIRAAQRDGKKYRCAASYAGVSDLNRMLKHHRNFLYGGARGDWLRKQAPDLKNVSPLNFPGEFSIPLLLMHGDEDRVVPPVQSKVLAQKLKAAGKDVTYIVQPEGDHHFSRTEDRLEFLKALEAFLAKHNPA